MPAATPATDDDGSSVLTSLPAVISQLAQTQADPAMRDSLATIAALFAPVTDDHVKEEEGSCDDIPLDDIIAILDERHIIDDCVTLDGVYGDFINPYAFQAKKGNNNPDILS